MKNSYIIENEEIVFRRAKETDDFKEMALVLYDTDPFIYPFWFDKNIEDARETFIKLINTKGSMFYYEKFIHCI